MEYRYIQLEKKQYAFPAEEVQALRNGEIDTFREIYFSPDGNICKKNKIKSDREKSRLTELFLDTTSRVIFRHRSQF